MNNKKIVGVILVILAFFIIYFLYTYIRSTQLGDVNPDNTLGTSATTSNSTGTQSNSSSKAQSSLYLARDGVYVVQYTDNGFVPKTLQIPRGKSVRFINMSHRGLRVFSDVLTDAKFSELNQSKTIGKGSTYTFSFVTEGLWAYHNEVQPSDSASISVY